MSFFDKVVFKTFLLLALFSFFSASVFAATTTKYYLNNRYPNLCTTTSSDMCSAVAATVNNQGSFRCDAYSIFYQRLRGVTNQYGEASDLISYDQPSGINERSLACDETNGETFHLDTDTCQATCVVDPCKALEGQSFSRLVECGTGSCPNNDTLLTGTGAANCTKSDASLLPRPQQFAVNLSNSCGGSLEPGTTPTGFKVFVADNGKTNFPIFCSATYKYTGSSASLDDEINGLTSLSFAGVTTTTENGPCPSGSKKGSYALADGQTQWICVPDTPSNNNCPTGQIRDNSGTCVPTDQAGQCPTGQVRNSLGHCVVNSQSDTDGDGTPDEDDDTPNGNSGGSGGNGDNNNNNNSDVSDTVGDEGSGSQTGAGGKATASTAEGCTTAPPCSGDPLQCAAFVQDWKQNCQMMSVSQGDADRANALSKASNDEHKAQITAQDQKVTAFFGDFKNTANVSLSSGQCPENVSLSIMGKQMTLKFADSCFFWRLLRALVIVSAYLAAASIVFRSLA